MKSILGKLFGKSRKQTPSHKNDCNNTATPEVNSEDSSHQAGWEFREGKRHNLHFGECYAISPATSEDEVETAIKLMQPTTERCPRCDRTLMNMFQVDRTDPRFSFLPTTAASISFLVCHSCSVFSQQRVQAKLDPQGRGHWIKHPGQTRSPCPTETRSGRGKIPMAGRAVCPHSTPCARHRRREHGEHKPNWRTTQLVS